MIGVNDCGIIPNPGSGLTRSGRGFENDGGEPVGVTFLSEKVFTSREIAMLDDCWSRSAFNPNAGI